MSSTMWGENPTLLACGHLADPISGFLFSKGSLSRECFRCAREDENKRWQPVVAKAPDIEIREEEMS